MPFNLRRHGFVLLFVILAQVPSLASAQISAGFTNDFEDGTTQGWLINLLGIGAPPAAAVPTNVSSGGPGGPNDSYLRLTSLGGGGAGSRLMVINPLSWAGNYLTAGIASIRMNAINLGSTDLSLRFLLEDPTTGPPSNIAMSALPQFLAVGSGWQTIEFPLFGPGGLAALLGDVNTAMQNATVVRLLHSPAFINPPAVVTAQLGVDNITAVAVVPEPTTLALFGVGALALLIARRRR